ncbi:hypothetical protein EV182_004280 [Spiromyces aspiralis]|uniref:Uncharacterized protein n=1 Tax=Spiromyces aspiralis TaxID=68401 RepID=A0ACC1HSM0_9FUNG|nr:hypothetical protein EV182_004280 [Spiromyces aspiralis]
MVVTVAAAAVSATAASVATPEIDLLVSSCPKPSTITFNKSVPDQQPFPKTSVSLCYTKGALKLGFTAYGESSFYVNQTQTTNDDIWAYEVMEAFVSSGNDDPSTYLEFEVNPFNITYQAFVYNPSKVRAPGTPFDHFFINDPVTDGFTAKTTITPDQSNPKNQVWHSDVVIPLALFNADRNSAHDLAGSLWRMNFFRTITNETYYPNQHLGAWRVPDTPSFHITPKFGHVMFV